MTVAARTLPHDAVVLAGGAASRLGGVDKAEVAVAGRALLDRVLDATAGARRVVVVGPARLARPGVTTVLEDPPLGGPVAGVEAGLAALGAWAAGESVADGVPAHVLVLACDAAFAAWAVPDLLAAAAASPAADGAAVVDTDGRPQHLLAVYRRDALGAALDRLRADGGVRDRSVRRLVAGLDLVGVPDRHGAALDGDTWESVREIERRLERPRPPRQEDP